MVFKLSWTLVFLMGWSCLANVYVATNGNDATGDGTIGSPFASVSNAVVYARTLGDSTNRTITIRGGHYYNIAITLTSDTSDNNLTFEGYPGETAVLYGGMPITNWLSVSNGWYAASLPTYPGLAVTNTSSLTDWQVRMLLVNGVPASRAQYPTNGGSLYYTNTSGQLYLGYTNADLGAWLAVSNAEFQIDHSWSASTVGCSAIDTITQQVTFLSNPQYGLPFVADVKTYRVYNIAQGMGRPGQFYYDRQNRSIVYWPLSGQNPNLVECVVPTSTRIFWVKGRDAARISNIVFSNLTCAVATSPLVAEGDYGSSLGVGMISSEYVDNLVMDNVTIGPCSGHAFWSRGATYGTNEYIRNCIFQNCGGSAIQSGASLSVVSNNFIRSVGSVSWASPGIAITVGAVVSHNSIFDCTMAAVEGTYINNAFILNNHASNCMQVLRDFGAIYTWTGTNNVISSNFVEHIGGYAQDGAEALDWFHCGIYCDNFTSGYIISGNILKDVTRPLMVHACEKHTITNNIFLHTSDIIELMWRDDAGNSTFSRNIVYGSTNLYSQHFNYPNNVDNWDAVPDWRSNVFYSVINQAWGGTNNNIGAENGVWGIPTNSTASNPLFVKVPTGDIQYLDDADFGFQAGSPCPGLGIQPLSLEGIGYNGGLQHRLPDIKVSTLRVGNMRMAK